MEPRLNNYCERVLDELLKDELQLWELPPALAAIYYLGEACGSRSRDYEIRQLIAERDSYYRAAARGGFRVPIVPVHSKSYAELCRARGQFELAKRVEADMQKLQFNWVEGWTL